MDSIVCYSLQSLLLGWKIPNGQHKHKISADLGKTLFFIFYLFFFFTMNKICRNYKETLWFVTSNQVMLMLLVPGAHFGISACYSFPNLNAFSNSAYLNWESAESQVKCIFTCEMKFTCESEFNFIMSIRISWFIFKKWKSSNLIKYGEQ